MSTYIVIEISEKENVVEIMNILSQSKARFIVTNDIKQYAQEREQLNESKAKKEEAARRSTDSIGSVEPPAKRAAVASDSPDIVEIEPPARANFHSIVPKIEQPVEQYLMPPNYYQPETPLDPAPQDGLLSHLSNMKAQYDAWNEPTTTPLRRGRPRGEDGKPVSKTVEIYSCAVCGAQVKTNATDFFKRSNHAITHTDLRRYMCPAEGCDTKSRHRSNMSAHVTKNHPEKRGSTIISCMSSTEEEELNQMVLKCFPEFVLESAPRGSRRSARFTGDYEDNDIFVEEA